MKKIILTLFIFAQSSLAIEVTNNWAQDNKGRLIQQLQITCAGEDESICKSICQKSQSCQLQEDFCLNCAGTSSDLFRNIFTDINSLYLGTGGHVEWPVISQFLKQNKHAILTADSVYNFYRDIDHPELHLSFQRMCVKPAMKPLLVVAKNEMQKPTSLEYVICQGLDRDAQVFKVIPRGVQKNMSSAEEVIDPPLILQMSDHLTLPEPEKVNQNTEVNQNTLEVSDALIDTTK